MAVPNWAAILLKCSYRSIHSIWYDDRVGRETDEAESVMKKALSKTQIDRLGDRLRGGSRTDDDLLLLDKYRCSFGEAYEAVIKRIQQLGKFPTGRPAKSTQSIIAKLQRESIRLSQMQDIAGCRVVVTNIVEQELFVGTLRTEVPDTCLIDRRDNPSF